MEGNYYFDTGNDIVKNQACERMILNTRPHQRLALQSFFHCENSFMNTLKNETPNSSEDQPGFVADCLGIDNLQISTSMKTVTDYAYDLGKWMIPILNCFFPKIKFNKVRTAKQLQALDFEKSFEPAFLFGNHKKDVTINQESGRGTKYNRWSVQGSMFDLLYQMLEDVSSKVRVIFGAEGGTIENYTKWLSGLDFRNRSILFIYYMLIKTLDNVHQIDPKLRAAVEMEFSEKDFCLDDDASLYQNLPVVFGYESFIFKVTSIIHFCYSYFLAATLTNICELICPSMIGEFKNVPKLDRSQLEPEEQDLLNRILAKIVSHDIYKSNTQVQLFIVIVTSYNHLQETLKDMRKTSYKRLNYINEKCFSNLSLNDTNSLDLFKDLIPKAINESFAFSKNPYGVKAQALNFYLGKLDEQLAENQETVLTEIRISELFLERLLTSTNQDFAELAFTLQNGTIPLSEEAKNLLGVIGYQNTIFETGDSRRKTIEWIAKNHKHMMKEFLNKVNNCFSHPEVGR